MDGVNARRYPEVGNGQADRQRAAIKHPAEAGHDFLDRGHLPEVKVAAHMVGALAAIETAVAKGEQTPDEGEAVAPLLERHRRAIVTVEFENRISRLEKSLEVGSREIRTAPVAAGEANWN